MFFQTNEKPKDTSFSLYVIYPAMYNSFDV